MHTKWHSRIFLLRKYKRIKSNNRISRTFYAKPLSARVCALNWTDNSLYRPKRAETNRSAWEFFSVAALKILWSSPVELGSWDVVRLSNSTYMKVPERRYALLCTVIEQLGEAACRKGGGLLYLSCDRISDRNRQDKSLRLYVASSISIFQSACSHALAVHEAVKLEALKLHWTKSVYRRMRGGGVD